METPLFIKTDFKWGKNDPTRFEKYNNYTCRFTSLDGKKVQYTKAKMENYPLGNNSGLPTHVKCHSPKWGNPESVKLDMSVNGQDYSGDLSFTFYDNLDLYRIVPMSGPVNGSTSVKLYGSGFASQKEDVYFRWGVIDTEKETKADVKDYTWYENDFIYHAMVEGSEVLQAYKLETFNIEKKDYELVDGDKLKTYVGKSPRLPKHN